MDGISALGAFARTAWHAAEAIFAPNDVIGHDLAKVRLAPDPVAQRVVDAYDRNGDGAITVGHDGLYGTRFNADDGETRRMIFTRAGFEGRSIADLARTADRLGDGNGTATVGEIATALRFTSTGEVTVDPADVPIQLQSVQGTATDSFAVLAADVRSAVHTEATIVAAAVASSSTGHARPVPATAGAASTAAAPAAQVPWPLGQP